VGVPVRSRKTHDPSKVVKNRFPVGEESLVKCNDWAPVKRVLRDTETGTWYPKGEIFRCNEDGQWQVKDQSLNLKCVRKQSPKHKNLEKDQKLNFTKIHDGFHSVETPVEVQDSTESSSQQSYNKFSETPVYAAWPESKKKLDETANKFSETEFYAPRPASKRDDIPNLEHPSKLNTPAEANFFSSGLLPQSSEHDGTIPPNLRGEDNFSGPAIYEPVDYSVPQNLRGNKQTNNYAPRNQYSPVQMNYLPFAPSYQYSPYRYSPVLKNNNSYNSLPIPMNFFY